MMTRTAVCYHNMMTISAVGLCGFGGLQGCEPAGLHTAINSYH